MTSSEHIRAAIYARISSDREGEALGVQRQLEDCRRLLSERNWSTAGEYVDNNISAANPRKVRPEYQRLLRDIEGGRIDAVVVWAEDRLHRRPMELEEFAQVCERAGVTQLVTVSGTVDMGTGDGMLVARIKGAVAAEESRKISQRIRRKKFELAERGLPAGGSSRPFGYEDDHVTVRESEAAMIRDAVQKVLHGATLLSIRNEWQASGVRPVMGGETWATKSVRNTLIRPRYAGLREHKGEVIGDAVWDPIVDRESWDQVRNLLMHPDRRFAPTNNANYVLKGVLRCSVCGHLLTSMPRTSRATGTIRMYGCRKALGGGRCGKVAVTSNVIEGYLLPIIKDMADSPQVMEWAAAEDEATAVQVRALLQEQASDERLLTEMGDMLADGDLTRAAYARSAIRIRRRIDDRSQHLSAVRSSSVLTGAVNEQWDGMSADEQRTVVRAIVDQVIVAPVERHSPRFQPSRLTIRWAYGSLARLTGNEDDPAWRAEAVASSSLDAAALVELLRRFD